MDETEQVEDEPILLSIEGPNFFRIGFWLTLTYLVLVIGFSLWDWIDVALMKPNEWGDFLAGVFGPLALLWVVLGFLQQGSELRNSRDALLLQAKELRHSVDAQKDLVSVARDQYEIDKDNSDFERATAIEKNQPRLRLQLGRNSGDGNNGRIHHFSMENVGANCTDIEVYREIDGNKQSLCKKNILKTSDVAQFNIVYRVSNDIYSHLICAEYLDLMSIRKQRYFLVDIRENRVVVAESQGFAEPPLIN